MAEDEREEQGARAEALPRETDVCIVGGGVAGAVTALKLGRAGIRTLVLDAGGRHPPEASFERMERLLEGDDPWRTDHPERDVFSMGGEIDYPLNHTRVKAVGGSTLHWAGYTPRFLESDFRMRSLYGRAEDWPISYAELEPYYAEAEAELGVAGTADNPFASPRSGPFPLPGFPMGYDEGIVAEAARQQGVTFHSYPQARTSVAWRGRPPCATYSICRACPIRARYSGDIHVELAEATGRVRVVPYAPVVRLEADASGRRVRRAVVAAEDGSSYAVEARLFVVAAHAVESARLLLLSAGSGHPQGLANRSGRVGRGFMEHRSQHRVVEVDRPLYPDRKGFTTSLSQQFHDGPERADRSGFTLAGWAAGGPRFESLLRGLLSRSGSWGERFAEDLEQQVRAQYGHTLILRNWVEPLPRDENRVDLDPELRDVFGNPAPRLSYGISEYEREGHRKGAEVLTALVDALGGRPRSGWESHFGSHHAGTCRMGDDPERSVVDRNLKAHDLDNLYVVGSSAFVTLSLVNPTLTIVALAARLGSHLVQRRGGTETAP